MKIPSGSITTKLLLLFLLVGLTAVTVTGTYSFYSAKHAIIHRTMDHLISLRATRLQQLETLLASKLDALKLASENPAGGTMQTFLSGPVFRMEVTRSDTLFTITPSNHYLAGKTGVIRAQMLSMSQLTIPTDSAGFSDLFFLSDSDTGSVMIAAIRRILPDGRTGIFAILIPDTDLNRIMLQNNSQIGLGHSGEVYLTGKDQKMRSASRFLPNAVLRISVGSESARRALNGEKGTMEVKDYRGIRVFSAYEPVRVAGLQWAILAEMDYEEALIPVVQLRNDILLVSLILSLFILAIARLISLMVTQPIKRLNQAAMKLGEGDFSHLPDPVSEDEIGSLTRSFNRMSKQIQEERRQRISALYEGQEMERHRFSRELHDGLGQRLIAAKLALETVVEQPPAAMKQTLEELKGSMAGLIGEVRQISNDLMPAALSEFGLANALRILCDDIRRQTNLEVEFDAEGWTETETPGTTIYLYRIVQEGINNILRHANAQLISLQLTETRDHRLLILEDDGCGFDPSLRQVHAGNGLVNMKERANLTGGSLTIESEPGQGTTIRVKIPKP